MLFESEQHQTSEFVANYLYQLIGSRPYPLHEQMLMTTSVVTFKPDYIFEYGTHFGISSRIWYEIKRYFKMDYQIHTIDLPPEIDHIEHPKNNIGKYIQGISEINQHFGNGVDVALGLAKEFNAQNPLFFVDGDHEYTSVITELDKIYSAYPNASVLAHDTFMQRKEKGYNIGPALACEEAKEKYDLQDVKMNIATPGIILLYKELVK